MYYFCEKCGFLFDEKDKICPNCGTEVKLTQCNNASIENVDCSSEKIDSAEIIATDYNTDDSVNKSEKSIKKKPIKSIAVIGSLALILLFGGFIFNNYQGGFAKVQSDKTTVSTTQIKTTIPSTAEDIIYTTEQITTVTEMVSSNDIYLTDEKSIDTALYPMPKRTLSYNEADLMEGEDVKFIQSALIELNYDNVIVSGKYDKNTMEAVKRLQKRHNLSVTGEVDNNMAQQIDGILEVARYKKTTTTTTKKITTTKEETKKKTSKTTSKKKEKAPKLTDTTEVNADLYPIPTRKVYYVKGNLMNGEDVKYIQAALIEMNYYGVKVTGKYDKKTENAVIRFQKNHKLVVDGLVGPQTTKALDKYLELWRSTD